MNKVYGGFGWVYWKDLTRERITNWYSMGIIGVGEAQGLLERMFRQFG